MVTKELFSRRAVFLGAAIALVLVLLLGRLAFMQILQGAHYKRLAEETPIEVLPIAAPRGQIVSHTGKVLVTSRIATGAFYFNMGKKPSQAEVSELATIFGQSTTKLWSRLSRSHWGINGPVPLHLDLSAREYTALEEHKNSLPGILLEPQPVRDYLMGDVGAQVFGYVGDISPQQLAAWKGQHYRQTSIVGQTGLELQYQSYLRGKPGGQEVEVNRLGHPIKLLGRKPPVPGDTLQLTISQGLQEVAYQALAKQMSYIRGTFGAKGPATAGSVVVLDVHTGQVLAMVDLPSYNPNLFVQRRTPQVNREIGKIIVSHPSRMVNRAISDAYAPGSNWKLATAVAGLASGAITPSTIIMGLPTYWRPPYPHNWLPYSTGPNNLAKAIAQSCDTFFYAVGHRTGVDAMARWAWAMGLGHPTGIDLPGETAGFVPSAAWVEQIFGHPWYPGYNYNMAIGQGFDQATVLQLADYAASIADSGVRYRPYIVQKIIAPGGQVVRQFHPQVAGRVSLPAADWAAIHRGMELETHPGPMDSSLTNIGGTAGGVFAGFPIPVAGKTGTAQTNGPNNAFYLSYAPANNPQIAVEVNVEGGYYGVQVAPVAKAIYRYYFHLTKPKPAATKTTTKTTPAPTTAAGKP
ncbi:MAG: penicillin-binding protein 2 [Thermaerobacter sp.]|nr:penicillin-binding protein 2 [Thermaerobacter sp.]